MASPSEKAAVRSAALARRAAVGADARAAMAAVLAEDGVALARRRAPSVVSAFLPIRGEPDPRPLIEALAEAGFATALPATPPRGEPLRFRAWRPGDPLVGGRFGTAEPGPAAAELDPDLLFVPLAAFDAAGRRLGYGAGYYDGALRRLRGLSRPRRPGASGSGPPAFAVGVAFAAQEVDRVPVELHDEPLDAVLTERGFALFRSVPGG